MDKLILVLYVDIGSMDDNDAEIFVKKISDKLFTNDIKKELNGITFVIPVRGGGTRIESINPKFILNDDVYKEYKSKMEHINKELDNLKFNVKP